MTTKIFIGYPQSKEQELPPHGATSITKEGRVYHGIYLEKDRILLSDLRSEIRTLSSIFFMDEHQTILFVEFFLG